VGGILGTVGRSAAFLFNAGPAKIVPWAFALLFLAFAFQLEKRIPQPRFFAKFLLRAKLASMKPTTVATVLGLVTPLLPCGPLYLVLGVSLLPGSFIGGAFLMTSFALGTAPLFFLLQTQFTRIPLSAQSVQLTRRGLAFVSAMLLIWRAASGTGIATPGLCPFCHY
jgi:sulfite exporter TauE/SafE